MTSPTTVYLDHAATSWPKPPEVFDAMSNYLRTSTSPGRGGHRLAVAAAESLWTTRDVLAQVIGAPTSSRVVLTTSTTHALNLALWGFLRPGDHVVTTSAEHNSVIRPLVALRDRRGISFDCVRIAGGDVDVDQLNQLSHDRRPRLLALSHASNVTGVIRDLEPVCAWAAANEVAVLIDAAQTIGAYPIDIAALDRVDFLAFPGHKALLGPPGTGALYVAQGVGLEPMMYGGTGSRSESTTQPAYLPDGLESGTPNGVGFAGLAAATQLLVDSGVEVVRAHELRLRRLLFDGLRAIEGVTVVAADAGAESVGIVSFGVEGYSPSEVSHRLDSQFGILARSGLHCAPLSHRELGTFPEGTVRFSVGASSTDSDVAHACDAVAAIASDASKEIVR